MRARRYTVLTYIIGDYEQVHEIKERLERATYLQSIGYNAYQYKGLYQTGFMIRRCTLPVRTFENHVERRLLLCGEGERDRLDQVLASATLNMAYNNMSVLWFSERLLESEFITWYGHGSNDVVHQTDLIEPYAFNHPVDVLI